MVARNPGHVLLHQAHGIKTGIRPNELYPDRSLGLRRPLRAKADPFRDKSHNNFRYAIKDKTRVAQEHDQAVFGDQPVGHLSVPPVLLGVGEGLAGEALGALAQWVVPALHLHVFPAPVANMP